MTPDKGSSGIARQACVMGSSSTPPDIGPNSPGGRVLADEEDLRFSWALRELRRLDRRPGEAPSGGDEGMAAAAKMASS